MAFGKLALEYLGEEHELKVLQSAAGFYIGTFSNTEGPISRESREYYPTKAAAEEAFTNGTWTQRDHP